MVFSLDHVIHFHHHDIRADEWLLYEVESTTAGTLKSQKVKRRKSFQDREEALLKEESGETTGNYSLPSPKRSWLELKDQHLLVRRAKIIYVYLLYLRVMNSKCSMCISLCSK